MKQKNAQGVSEIIRKFGGRNSINYLNYYDKTRSPT